MTTRPNSYTTKEVAELLGLSDSRIRQICLDSHNTPGRRLIGRDHAGRWAFTRRDIAMLKKLPDRRRKKQKSRCVS